MRWNKITQQVPSWPPSVVCMGLSECHWGRKFSSIHQLISYATWITHVAIIYVYFTLKSYINGCTNHADYIVRTCGYYRKRGIHLKQDPPCMNVVRTTRA